MLSGFFRKIDLDCSESLLRCLLIRVVMYVHITGFTFSDRCHGGSVHMPVSRVYILSLAHTRHAGSDKTGAWRRAERERDNMYEYLLMGSGDYSEGSESMCESRSKPGPPS